MILPKLLFSWISIWPCFRITVYFYHLLQKIEGCRPPKLTGVIILDHKKATFEGVEVTSVEPVEILGCNIYTNTLRNRTF